MAGKQLERVLVVDIVGFDRRRINATDTPFTHGLFERYASQQMDGQPTTEVWPALVCGVNPGDAGHLLWHTKRRSNIKNGLLGRFINTLPDWLVTTVQLFPHFFFKHKFDVPAMPRWRRHQIEFHRLKYHVRWQSPEKYHVVGGAKTMFGEMGDDSNYRVVDKVEEYETIAKIFPTQHRLQMVELHAFDLISHWYLDKPEVISEQMGKADRCMKALHDRCQEEGVTFVLVMEHGQEPVRKEDHINLQKAVHATGVKRNELCYYNGVGVSRFWFDTDEAREKVTAAVHALPGVVVRTREELNEELEFTLSAEWGELYVMCEPGHLFHPHDYYHPLGNIVVGLRNKTMRQRMFDPYHKGYHGYMPGSPSEDAYAIVADDRVQPTQENARLMDFAPSMLHLLGVPTPDYMAGHPTFDLTDTNEEAAPSPAEPVIESATP